MTDKDQKIKELEMELKELQQDNRIKELEREINKLKNPLVVNNPLSGTSVRPY